jgi:hypothetical protein
MTRRRFLEVLNFVGLIICLFLIVFMLSLDGIR